MRYSLGAVGPDRTMHPHSHSGPFTIGIRPLLRLRPSARFFCQRFALGALKPPRCKVAAEQQFIERPTDRLWRTHLLPSKTQTQTQTRVVFGALYTLLLYSTHYMTYSMIKVNKNATCLHVGRVCFGRCVKESKQNAVHCSCLPCSSRDPAGTAFRGGRCAQTRSGNTRHKNNNSLVNWRRYKVFDGARQCRLATSSCPRDYT